jgi:hypothetical protein
MLGFRRQLEGDSMTIEGAVDVLMSKRHGDCNSWEIDNDDMVFGFRDGSLYCRFTHLEAVAIAEKLEKDEEARLCCGNISAALLRRKGEDLPQLEWRKQVDRTLENVEYTRNCHNDRFFRDEKQLKDHDYRIQAWGVCLSDALKKIIAQDERIAKLEAKLDEFENVATVDVLAKRMAIAARRIAVALMPLAH